MSGSVAPLRDSVRQMTPVTAPEDQRDRVEALLRLLKQVPTPEEPSTYKLVTPQGEVTELPESVFRLLERVIEVLAGGMRSRWCRSARS